MAKKAIPSLQASDAFAITPSDTLDVKSDPNNATNLYAFCYVHNPSAGATVRVDTVEGTTVTMYVAQGQILGDQLPLQVRRIYNTTPTPPANLIALIGYGGMF